MRMRGMLKTGKRIFESCLWPVCGVEDRRTGLPSTRAFRRILGGGRWHLQYLSAELGRWWLKLNLQPCFNLSVTRGGNKLKLERKLFGSVAGPGWDAKMAIIGFNSLRGCLLPGVQGG